MSFLGKWAFLGEVVEDVESDFALIAQWGAENLDGLSKLEAQKTRSAFMHGVYRMYTSIEAGIVSILVAIGEEHDMSGPSWHRNLLAQALSPGPGRPAILPDGMKDALTELRKARHVTMKGYRTFSMERTGRIVEAANRVAEGLADAFSDFVAEIDQDSAPEPR